MVCSFSGDAVLATCQILCGCCEVSDTARRNMELNRNARPRGANALESKQTRGKSYKSDWHRDGGGLESQ